MPPTSQPNNPALQFAASYFAKPRFGNTSFTINHYADPVTYDCQTFLDKNRDYVIPDQILALEKSEFTLVRDRLFKKVGIQSSPSKSQQNFQFSSVTSQFKESLSQLMDNINSTYPHYIRCIKPNSFKKPGIFAKKQVLKQLKNGGVSPFLSDFNNSRSWSPFVLH
jgi:myosin-5